MGPVTAATVCTLAFDADSKWLLARADRSASLRDWDMFLYINKRRDMFLLDVALQRSACADDMRHLGQAAGAERSLLQNSETFNWFKKDASTENKGKEHAYVDFRSRQSRGEWHMIKREHARAPCALHVARAIVTPMVGGDGAAQRYCRSTAF